MGHSPAGLFGFSHMLGGYAGGQAGYMRVPCADVGPLEIENDSLSDEHSCSFISDPRMFEGSRKWRTQQ